MTEQAGQAAGRSAAQTWLIEMLTDAVNHHRQQLDEIRTEVEKLVADGSLDSQSALFGLSRRRR